MKTTNQALLRANAIHYVSNVFVFHLPSDLHSLFLHLISSSDHQLTISLSDSKVGTKQQRRRPSAELFNILYSYAIISIKDISIQDAGEHSLFSFDIMHSFQCAWKPACNEKKIPRII